MSQLVLVHEELRDESRDGSGRVSGVIDVMNMEMCAMTLREVDLFGHVWREEMTDVFRCWYRAVDSKQNCGISVAICSKV